jgi:hypothetical protein
MELLRWWYMSLSLLGAVSVRAQRREAGQKELPSCAVFELELVVAPPPRFQLH